MIRRIREVQNAVDRLSARLHALEAELEREVPRRLSPAMRARLGQVVPPLRRDLNRVMGEVAGVLALCEQHGYAAPVSPAAVISLAGRAPTRRARRAAGGDR